MENKINDQLLYRMLGQEVGVSPACDVSPSCGGKSDNSWGLVGVPLAMVYAPLQDFENIYEEGDALMAGTIFKDLDLPFMGKTVTKGGKHCG